jgi:hypothetical protein
MNRLSVTVFAAWALTSGHVCAEQLGDHGTFSIGIDRLFGYVNERRSYREGTPPVTVPRTDSDSQFSFLGRASSISSMPRLSFDALLGPGISVGGSFMYEHDSDTTLGYPEKLLGFWLISPRIGYAHIFAHRVGIWPRVGITYAHTSESARSNYMLSFTTDLNLLVTPLPNIGFTVGPTLDYMLSENYVMAERSNFKEYAIGVQAGFLVWF